MPDDAHGDVAQSDDVLLPADADGHAESELTSKTHPPSGVWRPTRRIARPPRAAIFDLGGVLLRTGDQAGRRRWEERLGLPPGGLHDAVFGSPTAAQASVGAVPASAVWTELAREYDLTQAELGELQRDFWSGDRFDPDLAAFLRSLRPRFRIAILSNAWLDARAFFTRDLGLAAIVNVLVISAEEGVMKPDPRIYLRTAARLNVRPEEAVFVDDVRANVDAAEAVGMLGVHFVEAGEAMREVGRVLGLGLGDPTSTATSGATPTPEATSTPVVERTPTSAPI